MRIQRDNSRLSFRRRRRSGCLPFVIILGVLVGIGTLSWAWLQDRLTLPLSTLPGASATLDTRLTQAASAFQRGDLDTAVALAREVANEEPGNIEALLLHVRALIYRSYTDYDRAVDRQTALDRATSAATRYPSNRDVLALRAFVLQAVGDPVQAAELARRVLDDQPEHTLARVALALGYGGVGSYDVALRESQRAAENTDSPWLLEARRAMAISYSDLGDYESAIRTAGQALDLNPNLTPLHFERALFAMQIGDADTATYSYFQVLTLDPDNVKARLRLCELSSVMRERDAAIRYCTEVTERAPVWADGWFHLGREYFLQGNFAAARDHLHRCSSLQVMQNVPVSERLFECWYLQGQAAEILGDCATLVATYNEFRAMNAADEIQQTWTYPPEGPPGCPQP